MPLALTMGDPAGIGLDITIASYLERARLALPPFVLYGDARALKARVSLLSLPCPVVEISEPCEALSVFDQALPVIPCPLAEEAHAGIPSSANADAVIAAIERAVSHVMAGKVSAVVTNPIAKSVLKASGFAFPGHTEFLAELAARATGRRVVPVMMLAADCLRVVPLTIHIPLADVPRAVSADLIFETASIMDAALRADFGIASPRIAVAGLNPHAGEDGTMGREDIEIIAPALDRLRLAGVCVEGPLPADTMFHEARRATYDAALAMFHDQALIPIKTLAFDRGVNLTLGLPFVRTSPDHGTAFSIAGRGRANPTSLIEALLMARRLAETRARAAHG